MTTIAPFIKNAEVTVAGTDVSDEASNITWTQTTSTTTFTPVSGNTVSDTTPGGWTLAFTYGEDWETETSLSNYIYEHEGDEVELTFKPKGSGTVTWTSKVTLALAGVGGGAGVVERQVTLASDRPVLSRGTVPAGE